MVFQWGRWYWFNSSMFVLSSLSSSSLSPYNNELVTIKEKKQQEPPLPISIEKNKRRYFSNMNWEKNSSNYNHIRKTVNLNCSGIYATPEEGKNNEIISISNVRIISLIFITMTRKHSRSDWAPSLTSFKTTFRRCTANVLHIGIAKGSQISSDLRKIFHLLFYAPF